MLSICCAYCKWDYGRILGWLYSRYLKGIQKVIALFVVLLAVSKIFSPLRSTDHQLGLALGLQYVYRLLRVITPLTIPPTFLCTYVSTANPISDHTPYLPFYLPLLLFSAPIKRLMWMFCSQRKHWSWMVWKKQKDSNMAI